MVVIFAKYNKKNGKIPPDMSAETDPMMSWILSDGVVWANRARKGAGGMAFGSGGGGALSEGFAS